MPFGDTFATWVGWLVEEDRPLVLLTEDPSDGEEIVRQLVRIGFDDLDGFIQGGMEGWERARLPVAQLRTVAPEQLHAQLEADEGPLPLDVRFGEEWELGHVPGARHIELGDLPEGMDSLPKDRSFATLCAAGFRAATAASILEREGFGDVVLVEGGTDAWREEGFPLEVPPAEA